MKVFLAFISVPDYNGPPPTLKSVHETLGGAKNALYPNSKDFRDAFSQRKPGYWLGPDGFGEIREVEVMP